MFMPKQNRSRKWKNRRKGNRRAAEQSKLFHPLCGEELEDRRMMAAGALDLSFGTGGLVTTEFFHSTLSNASTVNAAAVQSDGKVLAAGSNCLVRYNANGSLDS